MHCQFHTHLGSKTDQGLCSICSKDIPHCFCFASSKLIDRWRTPAPNAVRRIANTPTFSTTDASLTTFLRFPPEIRLQIYRLLLIADDRIRYHVCVRKMCFLVPPELRGKKEYRHGLFPAILEPAASSIKKQIQFCMKRMNLKSTAALFTTSGLNYRVQVFSKLRKFS
jgi:hypothetical protein